MRETKEQLKERAYRESCRAQALYRALAHVLNSDHVDWYGQGEYHVTLFDLDGAMAGYVLDRFKSASIPTQKPSYNVWEVDEWVRSMRNSTCLEKDFPGLTETLEVIEKLVREHRRAA